MIDLKQLEELVKKGESTTLEYKKSTQLLDRAFETICAFLNSNGGTVLIGVDNKGKIIGQEISDSTKIKIANFISQIEPPAMLDVEYVPIYNDKKVIVLRADANPSSQPFTFYGKPYWRIESTTSQMPQTRYKQLTLNAINKNRSWDSEEASLEIDMLDVQLIFKTIEESVHNGRLDASTKTNDTNTALKRLKLISNGKLTNASVVLFARYEIKGFTQCIFHMTRFQGYNKRNIIDSKNYSGNAFLLLYEAEQFIRRHTSIAGQINSANFTRKDIPEYPPRATREAIVNAICHRDYSQGGLISLMIYEDRLEVASYGSLPIGIKMDDLKREHESFPRNPKITHVMYLRGYVESIGTGTEEMVRECKELGLVEPDYFERAGFFVVRFWNKAISELNERQKKILLLIREHIKLKSTEILNLLSVKPEPRTLRRDLHMLAERGLIRLEGKGTSATWSSV